MVTKIIGADQVLALLFLSTDVTNALTSSDIEDFFRYLIKIKRLNRNNYFLEINFPMYKNFDQELFILDDQERIIMNPQLELSERKKRIDDIYLNMFFDDEEDIDNDFRMTISLYYRRYIDKKYFAEFEEKKKTKFLKRKGKSSGGINGKN